MFRCKMIQRDGCKTYTLVIFSLIFSAWIFQFLVTLSLPFAPLLDIVEIHFKNLDPVTQIRMGVWGACYYDTNNHQNCSKPIKFGRPYTVAITQGNTSQVIIQGWTGALAYHIVPSILTSLGFILVEISFFSPVKSRVVLVAAVTLGLALMTILQTLTIDFLAFIVAKSAVKTLGTASVTTELGPGYWINLTSFILLLAGLAVLLRRWFTD